MIDNGDHDDDGDDDNDGIGDDGCFDGDDNDGRNGDGDTYVTMTKALLMIVVNVYYSLFYTFSQQSIVELMEVLEHRKHEAILFTFKQVHYTLFNKQTAHSW